MHLTLLRHGLAVERSLWSGDDADRPLTEEGETGARRVCRALRKVIRARRILHSPLLRAVQTAKIASRAWDLPIEPAPWLAASLVGPAEIPALIPGGDLVLVGHEPDLSQLIGVLIGGAPIPLKKAGVAVLSGAARPRGMVLKALLPPRLVLGLK